MSNEVTAELARAMIDYDADTGCMTWRRRTPEMFSGGGNGRVSTCESWNKRYAGKPAFSTDSGEGYLIGSLNDQRLFAHRVAWLIVHGAWPNQIDHINGNRSDNRIANLRNVSAGENSRNQKMHSDNSSGFTGVYFSERAGRWQAEIRKAGKYHYIGLFDSAEDAAAARAARQNELGGFSLRHGQQDEGINRLKAVTEGLGEAPPDLATHGDLIRETGDGGEFDAYFSDLLAEFSENQKEEG